MAIREEFDYTFVDPHGVMFCLESRIGRGNEDLWLRLLSPSSDKVIVIKPTREQWLEFRATLNHVLDAEDVTALSAVKAKEPVDLSKDIANIRRLRAEELAKRSPPGLISFDQEVPVELLKLPPAAAEQKATFERWLDKHCLEDTDLNDPPIPEEAP